MAGARENNLKDVTASFPLGLFVCVTGVSGAGKSTLVNHILYPAIARALHGSDLAGRGARPDRRPRARSTRSSTSTRARSGGPRARTRPPTPSSSTSSATSSPSCPRRGCTATRPGRFSFNVKGGRCEACEGDGVKRVEMHFLPDVYVPCEVCHGRRFNEATLAVKYNGLSVADVLDLTVDEALQLFKNHPNLRRSLETLADVGLGYIALGQSSPTLSGGEAQRVKLSRELSKRSTGRTLYILDEPTTGLHFDDIKKLLRVLDRLVEGGNTVVVIEHNLDVIKTADWVIDLGPEGGDGGGTDRGGGHAGAGGDGEGELHRPLPRAAPAEGRDRPRDASRLIDSPRGDRMRLAGPCWPSSRSRRVLRRPTSGSTRPSPRRKPSSRRGRKRRRSRSSRRRSRRPRAIPSRRSRWRGCSPGSAGGTRPPRPSPPRASGRGMRRQPCGPGSGRSSPRSPCARARRAMRSPSPRRPSRRRPGRRASPPSPARRRGWASPPPARRPSVRCSPPRTLLRSTWRVATPCSQPAWTGRPRRPIVAPSSSTPGRSRREPVSRGPSRHAARPRALSRRRVPPPGGPAGGRGPGRPRAGDPRAGSGGQEGRGRRRRPAGLLPRAEEPAPEARARLRVREPEAARAGPHGLRRGRGAGPVVAGAAHRRPGGAPATGRRRWRALCLARAARGAPDDGRSAAAAGPPPRPERGVGGRRGRLRPRRGLAARAGRGAGAAGRRGVQRG